MEGGTVLFLASRGGSLDSMGDRGDGRKGGARLGILFQRQSQWDPLMNLSVGLKAGCQPPPGALPVTHAGPETPHGGGVVCWARV